MNTKDPTDIVLLAALGILAVTAARAPEGESMEAEDRYATPIDQQIEASEPMRLPTIQPSQPKLAEGGASAPAASPPPVSAPPVAVEPPRPIQQAQPKLTTKPAQDIPPSPSPAPARAALPFWYETMQDAIAEHNETGDPIFVMVTIDGCQQCQEFKARAATNEAMRQVLDRVVLVEINADHRPADASHFSTLGEFPQFSIYWPPNGKSIPVERGLSVDEFVRQLNSEVLLLTGKDGGP